mgnify:CR=1 FL=1
MKKWLIRCLTVLAMVCLIPGIVLKAAAETAPVYCLRCGSRETREILGYRKYDSTYHRVYVTECQNCHNDGNVTYLQVHTGGTQGPTCTEGKICEKCGEEYDIPGHDWGAWTPKYDGTNTHTRRCKRCNAEETGSCSGGYATCDSLGMCNTCGGSYYGGHAWGEWSSAGNGTHTRSCTNYCREVDTANCTGGTATCSAKAVCEVCGEEYGEKDSNNHDLEQHAAKAPTCTEIGWDAYKTCSRCNYTTYAELPALNHDYQAVTVEPTCEADGYTIFTCSRCKDSYTADPTDKLGHQFGAWSPNGTGAQSADCLRQGCAHTGSTDCRKFTFRTAEGETLTFCPVCGQAENAAQLEKIEAATAWANSGSLSAEDVTARTNGEYLSVAFETAGSLTQPTGRVRLALPAGLLEGKTLVRIAPDGTQTEMPFETERGTIILTLDFANSELPVMLFRLVPQTAAL